MTDYRLVPVEPTPEMVEAAEDAYMPFGDMEMAIRMALLTAPAVQPATDVARLVEALERVTDCLSKALTGGEVRAADAGRALTQAGELLAAHRKQGGGV